MIMILILRENFALLRNVNRRILRSYSCEKLSRVIPPVGCFHKCRQNVILATETFYALNGYATLMDSWASRKRYTQILTNPELKWNISKPSLYVSHAVIQAVSSKTAKWGFTGAITTLPNCLVSIYSMVPIPSLRIYYYYDRHERHFSILFSFFLSLHDTRKKRKRKINLSSHSS